MKNKIYDNYYEKHFPQIMNMLFTKDCPLDCEYCNMRNKEGWKTDTLSIEEIEKIWQAFAEVKTKQCKRILLTGGEPFIHIKKLLPLMEKYKDVFEFEFNTSGYYLTSEVLKELINYKVRFNLSVDGPREVSNYMRPLYDKNATHTYWDRFEENIPGLLYYYPNVEWKQIITKRTINLLYSIYLTAEKYGFREIKLVSDLRNTPCTEGDERRMDFIQLEEEDYASLYFQVSEIINHMLASFRDDVRPLIPDFVKRCLFIWLHEEIPENIIFCGVAAGRFNAVSHEETSVNLTELSNNRLPSCLNNLNLSSKEIEEGFISLLEKSSCDKDPLCKLWRLCKTLGCIQQNAQATGRFDILCDEYCTKNKIFYSEAWRFLTESQKIQTPALSRFFSDIIEMEVI